MKLRCAVYARYSSDRQSPLSITDQVRKCREFAERQGWQVLDEHIYSDQAVTGTTAERVGLRQLLETATSPGRPFDALLVDDTSRLSRTLADALRIADQLRFARVRVLFVSQGIDTESEQADVLLATHGIVDSLYVKELAKKTHRGLEGKFLRGLHTGSRCYGYRRVPVEDPTRLDSYGRAKITGVRLAIDECQAAVVRCIFSDYAAGLSLKAIAKRLNVESVPPPAPYRGQRHASWSPPALSWILHNERYRGRVVWNKTRKLRNPLTGKRLHRPRDSSEWKVVEMPHLRIISDELWLRVQERLEFARQAFARGGWARPYLRGYLLSGILKCGLCGSNLALLTNRSKAGVGKYGCSLHRYRGVCNNRLLVRRDEIETEVLTGLQREVLRDEVVTYTIAAVKREVRKRLAAARDGIAGIRRRRDLLQRKIENLVTAVSDGYRSPALLAELGRRELELQAISDKLLAADETSLEAELREIEEFVLGRLGDVRTLLLADVQRARAELSKHCREILVIPTKGGGYGISGEWDLLGGEPVKAGCSAATTISGGM